jgi:acetyl/propionyl-CoA carboxylase alpha subunit
MSHQCVRTFRKILIANRGEIAVRIARTCREMGIASVAVYSEADRFSPHVCVSDEAVHIGDSAPSESYLNISRVLAAARSVRADAIHPGYGFLSENPSFALACAEAGIEFIGPSAETIAAMGEKIVARATARNAGLPILPGYEGADQSPAALRAAILELGLPVMIKAAAGGGGRGMRIVRNEAEIEPALTSAASEARRAFGDGRLFVERLIEGARHVEVQIVGDKHGNVLHFFERDCSLQRRHQKLIEESPAPHLSTRLRGRLHEMSVALGQSIGYSNAGTVEFLVTPDETPYFIEVNSRLQVEHPVTELVTGVDLVRLQIEVAQGYPIRFSQKDISLRGHAIEARLYAEDAPGGFLPTSGVIGAFELPQGIEGMRVDSGVTKGFEVGTSYDGLLAKIASFGSSREDALRKLTHGLTTTVAQGLTTNRTFLIRLLEHDAVVNGEVNTAFIAKHLGLLTAGASRQEIERAATAIAVYLSHRWRTGEPRLSRLPLSYCNNPSRQPAVEFQLENEILTVLWRELPNGRLQVTTRDGESEVSFLWCSEGAMALEINGIQHRFRILEDGENFSVSEGKEDIVLKRVPRFPLRGVGSDAGVANAPMPGQVLKILVEKGQHVTSGQALIVLEAMKMEQTIRSVVSGVVGEILVERGAVVVPGELLVRIVSEETSAQETP